MTGIQSLKFKRESETGIQASITWKTCFELTHFCNRASIQTNVSVHNTEKSGKQRSHVYVQKAEGQYQRWNTRTEKEDLKERSGDKMKLQICCIPP